MSGLVTNELRLMEDGNLLLTIRQDGRTATIKLDAAILLQTMKVDINQMAAMRTLVRRAHTFLLTALAEGNLDKGKVADWLKTYDRLLTPQ